MSGSGDELLNDSRVRPAYLGLWFGLSFNDIESIEALSGQLLASSERFLTSVRNDSTYL
jgi:hypothetical protein